MKQKRSIVIVLILFILLMGSVLSGSVLASDGQRLDPADLGAIGPATFTLKKSSDPDGPTWSDVLGNLTVGYSTNLGQTEDYIYIQVDSLVADPALESGLHEIYFDSFRVPEGFWDYWSTKGIDEDATGDDAVMWQILNGDLPMFYIKSDGGSYSLVDGYLYETADDEETPWRVNDDLPLATYHFGGEVFDGTDTEYLNIQITFTQQATVSITPQTSTIDGCGYLDVYIHLANVHDLYAVDISLTFDETVLEVVDMDPDDPDTAEIEGEPGINLLPVDELFVAGYWVNNEADNTNGTIQYTAAQLNTTAPANGSGNIAKIRFRAKSVGSSDISIINAELSDRDGYLVGRPITWDEPAATITTQYTEASTPVLNISRLNASDVQLSWDAESTDDVSSYHLYRSDTPYFDVDASTPYEELANTGTSPMTFDDSVLGNVDVNYFYALKAECVTGLMSPASDQVGKFEYRLWETATTDFNWIGLVLETEEGWTDARALAAHIEENYTDENLTVDYGVIVRSISKWLPMGQNYETCSLIPFVINNFNVELRSAYRIVVDLSEIDPQQSTDQASIIWTQVGNLPDIVSDFYTLYDIGENNTSFNWIIQPLEKISIDSASELAADVDNYSSGNVSIGSISQWGGLSQGFSNWNSTLPFINNYETRFGYPYRLSIIISEGTSVQYPRYE